MNFLHKEGSSWQRRGWVDTDLTECLKHCFSKLRNETKYDKNLWIVIKLVIRYTYTSSYVKMSSGKLWTNIGIWEYSKIILLKTQSTFHCLDKQFLNIWEIQLITTLLHLDFTQKQISNEGTKGKANKMDNFCQSPKKHLIKIYTPTWHARGFLHRTTYPCPKLTLIRCIWNNRKSTWLSNPLTSSRLTSWAGMLFKVIKSNKKGGNEMLGRDLDNLPLSPALCSGLKQKG